MLIAVVSLKGAPGVSAFAHALAASWPQPARCVLVEADPSGGDLATRFALAPTPGLVSLAAARHDRDPLWRHTQTLPDGVVAVPGPAGADQARAALRAVMSQPATDPEAGGILPVEADTVAVLDCGRIGSDSPAMPLVEAADAMLLLTRAAAMDLIHIAASLPRIAEWTRRPALLLVGAGYTTSEVAHELGIPVMARIPYDRRGAAALSHGRARPRRARSALARVAREVARALDAQQHGLMTDNPTPADPPFDRPDPRIDSPNGAAT